MRIVIPLPEGAFTVNGDSYQGDTIVTLPVEGAPHPVIFLPVEGRRTPPATIAAQESGTITGTYRWAEEVYLEKEGQPEVWIKLSTPDLAEAALQTTNTNTEVYLRETDGVFMGEAAKALVLRSEFYQPS